MNSSLTLSITTFVYGFSAFLYLVGFVFRRQTPGVLGTWVALLGLIGNAAGIGMRWVESYRMGIGHAPLSNLYESLVFFALTITMLYLFHRTPLREPCYRGLHHATGLHGDGLRFPVSQH